ncbi:MAG TPA: hypothetical protein VF476_14980, partial [Chitinophagaceae bacterium]
IIRNRGLSKCVVMISIEKCKKVLEKNGKKYTAEEIQRIRELLYKLATIEYQEYKGKPEKNNQLKSVK